MQETWDFLVPEFKAMFDLTAAFAMARSCQTKHGLFSIPNGRKEAVSKGR
jgi:hypothetical protein